MGSKMFGYIRFKSLVVSKVNGWFLIRDVKIKTLGDKCKIKYRIDIVCSKIKRIVQREREEMMILLKEMGNRLTE